MKTTPVLQEQLVHSFTEVPLPGQLQGYQDSIPIFAQVFRLRFDSLLVCRVKGSELKMSLVHLNESHKRELEMLTQQQMVDQRLIQQEITLSFQGHIIPSLHLTFHLNSHNSDLMIRDANYMQYSLLLATSHNLVYNVDFNPYFFKRSESVVVREPFHIGDHLTESSLCAFAVATDSFTLQKVFVFGLKMSPQMHPVTKDIGIALQMLFFDQGIYSSFQLQDGSFTDLFKNTPFSLNGPDSGLGTLFSQFGKVTYGIAATGLQATQTLGKYLKTNEGNQEGEEVLKIQQMGTKQQINHPSYSSLGDEIGVVSVYFSNLDHILYVIFDDGTLRAKKVSSETDFGSLPFLINHQLILSHQQRVTAAKIQEVKSEDSTQYLCVAYKVESDLRSEWKYEKFQMGLNGRAFQMLQSLDLVDSYQQSLDIIDLVVLSLSELHFPTFHIYAYLWDDKASQGSFLHLDCIGDSSLPCLMDLQTQDKLIQVSEQLSDQDKLSAQMLLNLPPGSAPEDYGLSAEFEPQMRQRVTESLVSLYRFCPQTVQEVLKKQIRGWEGTTNEGWQSQLMAASQKLSLNHLRQLRDKLLKVEAQTNKPLCLQFSPCENIESAHLKFPIVVVSKCNITLFRQLMDQYLVEIQSQIDVLVKEGFEMIQKFEQTTFSSSDADKIQKKIVFGGNMSNIGEVFRRVQASLILVLGSRLHPLRIQLLHDPASFPSQLHAAFESDFKFEQIHHGIHYLLTKNKTKFREFIDSLQSEILAYFNSELPQRAHQLGEGLERSKNEWKTPRLTENMLRFLETCVLSDLDKLERLMEGLLILKEFIRMHGLDEESEEKQVQDDILFRTRFLQLLALSQILHVQLPGNPHNKSVVSEILAKDDYIHYSAADWLIGKGRVQILDAVLAKYLSCESNPFHPNNFSVDLIRTIKDRSLIGFKTNKQLQHSLNEAMCQYLKLFPTSDLFPLFDSSYLGGEEEMEYQKLLVEFYRGLSIAVLDEEMGTYEKNSDLDQNYFSSFIEKIDYCLSLLFKERLIGQLRLEDFCGGELTHHRVLELQKVTNNRAVYAVALLMAEQFSSFTKDGYQLRILCRTLDKLDGDYEVEGVNRTLLKNTILERVFEACRGNSEGAISMMFDACKRMDNLHPVTEGVEKARHQRVHFMHRFMERVLRTQESGLVLEQHRMTSKEDIQNEQIYQFERLRDLLSQKKWGEERKRKEEAIQRMRVEMEGVTGRVSREDERMGQLQRRVRDLGLEEVIRVEIQVQLQVIVGFGQIYRDKAKQSMQELWSAKSRFEREWGEELGRVSRELEREVENSELVSESMVEQTEQILKSSTIHYLSVLLQIHTALFQLLHLSDSQSLKDDSNVKTNCSDQLKRKLHEIDDLNTTFNTTLFDSYPLPLLHSPDSDFFIPLTGTIKIITKSQIAKYICEFDAKIELVKRGHLVLAEDINDATLSQLLSHYGLHWKAVALGVYSDSDSGGLAVADLLISIQNTLSDEKEIDWNRILPLTRGIKVEEIRRLKKQEQFQTLCKGVLNQFADKLNACSILSLSKVLIKHKICLPLPLIKRIHGLNLVTRVLRVYQNENLDPHPIGMARLIMGDGGSHFRQTIQQCLETEPNLVHKLPAIIKIDIEYLQKRVEMSKESLRIAELRQKELKLASRGGEEESVSRINKLVDELGFPNLGEMEPWETGRNKGEIGNVQELVAEIEDQLGSEEREEGNRQVEDKRREFEEQQRELREYQLIDIPSLFR